MSILSGMNDEEIYPLHCQHDGTYGLIILNPAAGEGNPDQIKAIVRSLLGQGGYDLYETTGNESLDEVVRSAVQQNKYEWVAAVGGDGTVSLVADGLVGTGVPLAILPAGTGNALAQEFGIPQEIEAACQLLLGDATVRQIDGIRVGQKYFFLQMGVGLESVTMQNTPSSQKNKWGPIAYLWTAMKEAFGWQPHHFTLRVDGQTHHIQASELVIANARQIGVFGLEWHDKIIPDDGQVDIAVVHARSLVDYARVLWALLRGQQYESGHIQFFTAHNEVRLEAEQPLPFHGDGEMLTNAMPLTAVVVPGALSVIVPQQI